MNKALAALTTLAGVTTMFWVDVTPAMYHPEAFANAEFVVISTEGKALYRPTRKLLDSIVGGRRASSGRVNRYRRSHMYPGLSN